MVTMSSWPRRCVKSVWKCERKVWKERSVSIWRHSVLSKTRSFATENQVKQFCLPNAVSFWELVRGRSTLLALAVNFHTLWNSVTKAMVGASRNPRGYWLPSRARAVVFPHLLVTPWRYFLTLIIVAVCALHQFTFNQYDGPQTPEFGLS